MPGLTGVLVDLHLMSDLAELYLLPGATFTLRYPIRGLVGHGRVLDEAEPS